MVTIRPVTRILCLVAGVALLLSAAPALAALSATANISTSSANSPFNYALTVNNTGTTNIGTFWFAWTNAPTNYDFLPTSPTNILAPTGWTYAISHNGISGDGYGIEFYTIGNVLAAGQSLSGFSFTDTVSPQSLGNNATVYPDPIKTSFVFQDYTASGTGFALQPTLVPEPSAIALAGIGGFFGWMAWRRRRSAVRHR